MSEEYEEHDCDHGCNRFKEEYGALTCLECGRRKAPDDEYKKQEKENE